MSMAVNVTGVLAGANIFIADIEITAADVASGNIPHGLGAAPLEVEVTPLRLSCYASTPFFAVYDATNLALTFSGAGADAGFDQMRVIARRPFRMVQ